MSSALPRHDNPLVVVATLGFTVQDGSNETTSTVLDIRESPSVYVASTSRNIQDAHLMNDDLTISVMSREEEKLLNEVIYENQENGEQQSEELGLGSNEQHYIEGIKELQFYLDTLQHVSSNGSSREYSPAVNMTDAITLVKDVKKKVRPGCSQELLNVALTSMSMVARVLTVMSAPPKRRASL